MRRITRMQDEMRKIGVQISARRTGLWYNLNSMKSPPSLSYSVDDVKAYESQTAVTR
jgi:hypothetical protein